MKIEMLNRKVVSTREIVVIGNHITCKIGSFGMEEDLLFMKASELARKLGLPRIFLLAKSGARIFLAEELNQYISKVC